MPQYRPLVVPDGFQPGVQHRVQATTPSGRQPITGHGIYPGTQQVAYLGTTNRVYPGTPLSFFHPGGIPGHHGMNTQSGGYGQLGVATSYGPQQQQHGTVVPGSYWMTPHGQPTQGRPSFPPVASHQRRTPNDAPGVEDDDEDDSTWNPSHSETPAQTPTSSVHCEPPAEEKRSSARGLVILGQGMQQKRQVATPYKLPAGTPSAFQPDVHQTRQPTTPASLQLRAQNRSYPEAQHHGHPGAQHRFYPSTPGGAQHGVTGGLQPGTEHGAYRGMTRSLHHLDGYHQHSGFNAPSAYSQPGYDMTNETQQQTVVPGSYLMRPSGQFVEGHSDFPPLASH
ncbi:hypothetical protein F5Y18DRAFT_425519 [Xylariaceae sp. FL1019]|nr:hypothetical protein F5Y18DRAFT_425519 [Xylariaceae sp. FL1019]